MKCRPCNGTGRASGKYEALCELCGGRGRLPDDRKGQPECPPCKGTGRKWGKCEALCEVCGGYGLLPTLSVWRRFRRMLRRIAVLLGVAAAFVTLLVFLSGRSSLADFLP